MAVSLRTSRKGFLKRRLVPVKALSVRPLTVVLPAVVLPTGDNLKWTGRGKLRSPVFQGLVCGGAS